MAGYTGSEEDVKQFFQIMTLKQAGALDLDSISSNSTFSYSDRSNDNVAAGTSSQLFENEMCAEVMEAPSGYLDDESAVYENLDEIRDQVKQLQNTMAASSPTREIPFTVEESAVVAMHSKSAGSALVLEATPPIEHSNQNLNLTTKVKSGKSLLPGQKPLRRFLFSKLKRSTRAHGPKLPVGDSKPVLVDSKVSGSSLASGTKLPVEDDATTYPYSKEIFLASTENTVRPVDDPEPGVLHPEVTRSVSPQETRVLIEDSTSTLPHTKTTSIKATHQNTLPINDHPPSFLHSKTRTLAVSQEPELSDDDPALIQESTRLVDNSASTFLYSKTKSARIQESIRPVDDSNAPMQGKLLPVGNPESSVSSSNITNPEFARKQMFTVDEPDAANTLAKPPRSPLHLIPMVIVQTSGAEIMNPKPTELAPTQDVTCYVDNPEPKTLATKSRNAEPTQKLSFAEDLKRAILSSKLRKSAQIQKQEVSFAGTEQPNSVTKLSKPTHERVHQLKHHKPEIVYATLALPTPTQTTMRPVEASETRSQSETRKSTFPVEGSESVVFYSEPTQLASTQGVALSDDNVAQEVLCCESTRSILTETTPRVIEDPESDVIYSESTKPELTQSAVLSELPVTKMSSLKPTRPAPTRIPECSIEHSKSISPSLLHDVVLSVDHLEPKVLYTKPKIENVTLRDDDAKTKELRSKPQKPALAPKPTLVIRNTEPAHLHARTAKQTLTKRIGVKDDDCASTVDQPNSVVSTLAQEVQVLVEHLQPKILYAKPKVQKAKCLLENAKVDGLCSQPLKPAAKEIVTLPIEDPESVASLAESAELASTEKSMLEAQGLEAFYAKPIKQSPRQKPPLSKKPVTSPKPAVNPKSVANLEVISSTRAALGKRDTPNRRRPPLPPKQQCQMLLVAPPPDDTFDNPDAIKRYVEVLEHPNLGHSTTARDDELFEVIDLVDRKSEEISDRDRCCKCNSIGSPTRFLRELSTPQLFFLILGVSCIITMVIAFARWL